MITNTFRALVAGAALAFVAQAAVATTTVTINGTTNSSQVSGTASTFTATMVYDETATTPTSMGSSNSGPYKYNNAVYNALMSLSFTSGTASQTINAAGATANVFRVTDSANSNVLDSESAALYIGNNNYMQAIFSGSYTTLSSVSIADPTAFAGSASSGFYYENANGDVYAGKITSFAVTQSAAPEPATWAMMLMGFGAIGFSMRSRQRKVGVSFN